jgi:RNA polymerase sigma factor (sigma-70 family)
VRITWRLALDRQRANRRRTARELTQSAPEATAPSAIDTLAARERLERLWQAIDGLPDKLRVVTVLAGIEGHDLGQVALLLGLPEGTVKSRLFLASLILRDGQTSEFTAATDKITGEVTKIDVTLTVIK